MPFNFALLLPLISAILVQFVHHSSSSSSFSHVPMTIPDQFELNPAKIDMLLRRTALMALLRAKANALMDTVPLIEQVLFKQCVAESKEAICPVKLAKCLAKLIRSSRDQQQLHRQNKWAERNESTKAAEKIRQKLISQHSSKDSNIKLRRIRHFFALWRRREGRRKRKEMMGMKQRRWERAMERRTTEWSRKMKRMGRMGEAVRTAAGIVSRRDSFATTTGLLNESLRNLRELERYMQIFERARRSIARINAQNTELVSRFNSLVNVRSAMPDGPPALVDLQQQIARFFDSLGIDQIALLSPRFFSLFPSPKWRRRRRPHLLSPDLFSFYTSNNDSASVLSIPDMLNSANLGERESAAWLELLLNITGSAKM
ncbi:hypothetical protein niasHS_014479 [Heterodera schachtii]|uniref:Uncharacterized protein n=1 Tax=Heterodera schachtii TaxID=97005 RepID=A0ABD2I852_HETSC